MKKILDERGMGLLSLLFAVGDHRFYLFLYD